MGETPEAREEGGQATSNPSLKRFHDSATSASWIFGGLILLFLMLVVLVEIDDSKLPIVRFLMALSAAFFALFFVGGVLLQGTLNGLYISATGGFVLFILVQFVFNPFAVITTTEVDKGGNTNNAVVVNSSTPSASPAPGSTGTQTPPPPSPTPPVSSNNQAVLRAAAEAAVAMMVADDFSGVWEKGSSNFKANLSPVDMRSGWDHLVERFGPFQKQVPYRVVRDQNGNDEVVIRCNFKSGAADVQIFFDNERQIIGLWFFPVNQ